MKLKAEWQRVNLRHPVVLFRGAGPNEPHELNAERMAEDSLAIASGGNPINMLKKILHEYIGFTLFCACGFLAIESGRRTNEVSVKDPHIASTDWLAKQRITR